MKNVAQWIAIAAACLAPVAAQAGLQEKRAQEETKGKLAAA